MIIISQDGKKMMVYIHYGHKYFDKKLFEKASKYFKSINLYYNDFGKDFGVPKNKIVLVRQRC